MLRTRQILFLQKRWKGKKIHWSVLNKKKFAKDKALTNFDDFYGSVFGNRWSSIRAALLTQHKYIAMVNTFGDVENTSSALEMEGAINIKSLVNLAKRRLEISNLNDLNLKHNAGNELDDKLSGIIKNQETLEKQSIYPSNSSENIIPDKIEFNQTEKNKNQILPSTHPPAAAANASNFVKSLDQSDIEIDYSRLIDVNESKGGLYEFVPAARIKGMEDWIPESDHYKYYQTSTTDFPLSIELDKTFNFPENLLLYTYEKGNCSSFISPKNCLTGVQSHFLMDGASILPPLMLGIEKGDRVLDACAAPGGKSLLMLQTLYPKILVCNDVQESRVNRIRKIMDQFVFDFQNNWEGKYCLITQQDARTIDFYEQYDKILVDVPCTTDRHSVLENDNNIFKPSRIKERLKIPELQSELLTNCLRLLRPGGSLIYSTCSLSPVQNDGVVHMALQKCFTDYGITATIRDLSLVVQTFNDIFKFENSKSLKYGQLVLPFLPANFGPMYFSKITRNLQ